MPDVGDVTAARTQLDDLRAKGFQPDDPNTGAVNEAGNFKLTGASLSGINAGTYLGSSTTPGVSASFGGDSGFSASSGTANLTVDKAPSDVQVSCPTTAVTYTGNPLEPCTAKVTGTGVHH